MERSSRARWAWSAGGLVAGVALAVIALRLSDGSAGASGAREHHALGLEALEAGDYDEAAAAFAHAARLAPDDPENDLAAMRVRAHLITQRPDLVTAENSAAWAYEMKFLARHEHDRALLGLIHTAAGFVAARRGDHEGAITAYRAALEADPERLDANAALGSALAADEKSRPTRAHRRGGEDRGCHGRPRGGHRVPRTGLRTSSS